MHGKIVSLGSARSDRTYESILELILDGTLEPGARLREVDLAARLGVSRTPVREALRRLGVEGHLRFQRNRGAELVTWSRFEIEELYDLRLIFEQFAARSAIRNGPDLTVLRELAAKMESLVPDEVTEVSPDTWRRVAALNSEFHRTIFRSAGSTRLLAILESLLHAPLMLRTYSRYRIAGLRRSLSHHRAFIEAFEAGRPDWAESVARTHVRHARSVLLEAWIEPDEGTPAPSA